jgi:DNA mismatch repair ATPase MutS
MDTNLNILAAVILNGLFLFNLHLLAAVEKWKFKYREVIPQWFATIGEIDALNSLANFTANNPEFIFPVAVENQFSLEATDLGHPLIPKEECVTNDLSISDWNQYCIITGANMSGKSTFLRAVGVNYVLAMMGAPVFASRFIFYPVNLHSSIRTSDSLARKESFFYAELKRLKQIISELERGQQTFILLDEILKGTNSKDKQSGSIALIEQLVKYQSIGLIATHDLILGDLIRDYPNNIHNLCFEIHIVDDEMSINYKLQQGVCQNLNATYLMKKMGILIDK